MTDEQYLDSWLGKLGKCLDSADGMGRLRLMREARSHSPTMSLVATAIEFALPRIDSAEAAAKMAREIALRAKAMVNVNAKNLNMDGASTLGLDLSTDKQTEMVPNG